MRETAATRLARVVACCLWGFMSHTSSTRLWSDDTSQQV